MQCLFRFFASSQRVTHDRDATSSSVIILAYVCRILTAIGWCIRCVLTTFNKDDDDDDGDDDDQILTVASKTYCPVDFCPFSYISHFIQPCYIQ